MGVRVIMMTNMISNSSNYDEEETLSSTENPFRSWKLYENPFYKNPKHKRETYCHSNDIPLSSSSISSTLKVATPVSGSSRVFPMVIEKELELARAQIAGLKAEIEYERKARKKLETEHKRLAKELAEERRGRAALERVCEGLVKKISQDKAEIDKVQTEIEEEREMLRVAELLREERVQMKLAEAKVFFEGKLMELEGNVKQGEWSSQVGESSMKMEDMSLELARATPDHRRLGRALSRSLKFSELVLEKQSSDENRKGDGLESSRNTGEFWPAEARRIKASPEPENPHIRRGIKGFVEFPRGVRDTGGGSKHRQWGNKLECQKAQLRILLKPKYISNPVQ